MDSRPFFSKASNSGSPVSIFHIGNALILIVFFVIVTIAPALISDCI
jgi:hypothetical protein